MSFMLEEKTIQFANFNITFGENEEAMLMHFEDIVFPAFTGGYIRGKENELPRYSFGDVTIKMIDNEHVLVGNYIKDTEYRVVTTVQEGNLVPSPAEVPTAPYSRFIIFLKNHRMVLVKNESGSPDIRSFQKTVRDILSKYTHAQNRGKAKEEKLPFAIVNIVDIPLKDSIDEVLRNINKINWLKLRFFPLNNDLDPLPIAQAMKNEMAKVGSRTGNLVFNSPDSKAGVKDVLESTAGLAITTMKVTDSDGETRQIKEDAFSSSKTIPYRDNIEENGDTYIVMQAKKDGIISTVSPENATLYERAKAMLTRLKTRILALWTIPLTFAEEYFLICHKQIIRHPSIVLYVILRKTTSAISELSSFQIKLALHIKLRKEKIWSETTLSSIIPYYQLPLKRYPLLHLLTQKHFVPDIWINAASLTGKMCRSYPTSF